MDGRVKDNAIAQLIPLTLDTDCLAKIAAAEAQSELQS